MSLFKLIITLSWRISQEVIRSSQSQSGMLIIPTDIDKDRISTALTITLLQDRIYTALTITLLQDRISTALTVTLLQR